MINPALIKTVETMLDAVADIDRKTEDSLQRYTVERAALESSFTSYLTKLEATIAELHDSRTRTLAFKTQVIDTLQLLREQRDTDDDDSEGEAWKTDSPDA